MGSGWQNATIIFLILAGTVSCRNSENRIKQPLEYTKSEVIDTGSARVGHADNYILDNTSGQNNGEVYMFCEKMPEFPGGEEAFNNYLRKNITYPRSAVADKTEGRVVVRFIIASTGEMCDLKVLRSVRDDMDNECLRVFGNMPGWKPGTIDGKPVFVSYSVTVRFLLEKSENLNGIYILPSKNKS